jgi:hypothetical protein
MPDVNPVADSGQNEPWTADRLGAVLGAAAWEHFADRDEMILCSTGTCETYEVEEPDDPDSDDWPLILVRESDGARFEVDFEAYVRPLGAKAAAKEASRA